MKWKRQLILAFLCLFVIMDCFKKTSTNKPIIAGAFPKAIEKSTHEVILLFQTGSLIFDHNIDTTAITIPNPSLLYTDQHSYLFRLDSSFLVLLSKVPLTITIFKEDFSSITVLPTVHNKSNNNSYQAFALSSNSFFVSWVDNTVFKGRIFTYNDSLKAITENIVNKIELSNALPKAIVCDYHNGKYLCFCLSRTLNYHVLDSSLSILSSSGFTDYNSIEHPHVRYFKDNIFVLCFYYPAIPSPSNRYFSCVKMELDEYNDVTPGTKILLDESSYYSNENVDLMIAQGSLFTINKGNKNFLRRFTSNLDQLGNTLDGGSDLSNIGFPFLFTIEDDLIGYVYKRDLSIYVQTYVLPICKDMTLYTQITKSIELEFTFSFNEDIATRGEVMFFQLPRNALLQYNNDFVFEKQSKQIGTFTLITFLTTGVAKVSYAGIHNSEYGSRECFVTVTMCYFTCKECNTLVANSANHQCTQCLESYHPISDRPTMCVNEQTKNENMFLNSDGKYEICSGSCSSCTAQSDCIKCTEDYYHKEETLECYKKTDSFDFFFFDTEQNMFRKCYSTCKTCFNSGTNTKNNCIVCREEYESINPYDNTQCGTKCTGKWTYDKTLNKVTCVETADCPSLYPYLISSIGNISNQCVSSCNSWESNSDCVMCQEKRLFLHEEQKKCVETCPSPETEHDYINNKCINPSDPGPDPCPDPCPDPKTDPDPEPEEPGEKRIKHYQELIRNGDKIINYLYPNSHKDFKEYLIEENRLKSINNGTFIDLIQYFICEDYSMVIFKLDDTDIVQKVYKRKSVASINFSVIEDLKSKSIRSKSSNSIYVMQWDIHRPVALTNQVEYVLYNSDATPIETTSLLNQTLSISYPIRDMTNPFITKAMKMLEQHSIDIYDQSSRFFNDICFTFSSSESRDITIKDRRTDYYPLTEICQINCKYIKFNNKTQSVTCNCLYQETFTFVNETRPNPPSNAFDDGDYETYTAVTCALTVFTSENVLTNIAFWVFLASFVTMVVLAFCFICAGMSYASNYVKEVLKNSNVSNVSQLLPPCPPKSADKKSSSEKEEESCHTQLEEESFGEVKINNYQKKEEAPFNQNYIQTKETKPTPEEKDEKTLIDKLREALTNDNNKGNLNLQMYYFTKNSDNEANPNYSKKNSTEMFVNNTNEGRSMTNANQTHRFNKELLFFDSEEDRSKQQTPSIKLQKEPSMKHEQLQLIDSNSRSIKLDNASEMSKQIEEGTDNLLMIANTKRDDQLARPINQTVVNNDDDFDVDVKSPISFCRAYFNYIKRREIFLITFCSNKSYLPFFITFPIFLFCLTIMFTLHALCFTNGFIENRYRETGEIDVAYWFANEFFKCIYVALIGNVVKIIIVKILIFFVFRIEKKMLSKTNYNVILKRLRCRSTTIFVILIVMMGALFYINTCYCAVFKNTQVGLFIGFVVTVAFSFVIALLLCFVINVIRGLGNCCNCGCLKATYTCFKTIY